MSLYYGGSLVVPEIPPWTHRCTRWACSYISSAWWWGSSGEHQQEASQQKSAWNKMKPTKKIQRFVDSCMMMLENVRNWWDSSRIPLKQSLGYVLLALLHSFRRGQASILSIYYLYFPSNIGHLRYEFTYFLYELKHTQHVSCNQWELETQVINLCIIGSTSRSRTFELLTSDQTMHINPNFILYHFLLSSPFCASVQKPLCPGDL